MECHGLFIAHIHALDASVLLLPTELIDDGGMAEQSSLWLKSLLAPEALRVNYELGFDWLIGRLLSEGRGFLSETRLASRTDSLRDLNEAAINVSVGASPFP